MDGNAIAAFLLGSIMPELRFISGNQYKLAESKAILGPLGFEVIPISLKIAEIQTKDVEQLVEDKCVKAFQQIGRPLFVEHTGLFMGALNGFPGGLTEVFWETLQADRMCELFGGTALTARTIIGYCDGKRIYQFGGEISGTVSSEPRGDRSFQWDCTFVPDGYTQTFSELGVKKNDISMRRLALEAFSTELGIL